MTDQGRVGKSATTGFIVISAHCDLLFIMKHQNLIRNLISFICMFENSCSFELNVFFVVVVNYQGIKVMQSDIVVVVLLVAGFLF